MIVITKKELKEIKSEEEFNTMIDKKLMGSRLTRETTEVYMDIDTGDMILEEKGKHAARPGEIITIQQAV